MPPSYIQILLISSSADVPMHFAIQINVNDTLYCIFSYSRASLNNHIPVTSSITHKLFFQIANVIICLRKIVKTVLSRAIYIFYILPFFLFFYCW